MRRDELARRVRSLEAERMRPVPPKPQPEPLSDAEIEQLVADAWGRP